MVDRSKVEGLFEGTVPQNEAQTREWFVRPILEAIGYTPRDLISESNESGKYPDIAVLDADSPFRWYVEIKKWGHPLQQKEALQAVIYAYANGSRWAVLTDGANWQLYDANMNGVKPHERLVWRVHHTSVDFFDFLEAISKESVLADRLSRLVAIHQLQELLMPTSGPHDRDFLNRFFNALPEEMKKTLTEADLEGFLKSITAGGVSRETPPIAPVHDGGAAAGQKPINSTDAKQTPVATPTSTNGLIRTSFKALQASSVSVNMPKEVAILGKKVKVEKWVEVMAATLRVLHDAGRLPQLPIYGSDASDKAILCDRIGSEFRPRRGIEDLQRGFVFEGDRSADSLKNAAIRVLNLAGVDPDECFIAYIKRPDTGQ